MSPALSNAKLLSAFIARRGYAAAATAQKTMSGGVRTSVILKKGGEDATKTSWVPDPKTGYYRPEGKSNEVDAAELRAMLLKNKIRRN